MSIWGLITGADDATRAQTAALNKAQGYGDQALSNANAAWDPYASAGTQGMSALSALMQGGGNVGGRIDASGYALGADPGTFSGVGDLTQDPGYQSRMNAASAALGENQFLDGTWGSGAAAKEMAGYMQEQGANEYQNAYNRALTTYDTRNSDFNSDRNFGYQKYLTDLNTLTGDVNRQQSLATTMLGAGQNAAGATSGNWMNWGQQSGNNAMGSGNAKAQNAMATSPWAMGSGLMQAGSNALAPLMAMGVV